MAMADGRQPSVPPLFTARAALGDPMTEARQEAQAGCDSGLVLWADDHMRLSAAIIFAPEVPLLQAALMLPLCGIGLQNALGALAPPEVAVHLGWAGQVYVNGGQCGTLSIAAPSGTAQAIPDWLIIGLTLDFLPPSDDTGSQPDCTALYAEGCGDLDPIHVLEAWIRHSLVWLNRWAEDGPAPLIKEWTGLAHNLNQPVTIGDKTGTFLGVDQDFAMLMKEPRQTRLIPLTDLLVTP